ncbi:MAG: nuclear transport factor 2 family protein [Gammaproteobacteria bacterium]|nr:nuclear transport factor 2 family protein [Gammaproteobacteria bacterium]MBQ0838920.1 nuclear transport factor 2 family protein [Gammaproteobacteria bacterium]
MTNTALAVSGSDEILTRNEQLTRDFFAAWERADEAAITAAFAEDAIYHNIPYKPVSGSGKIQKAVKGFLKSGENMTFELCKLVVAGNTVVTERVDGWTQKGAHKTLPVLGIIEFNNAGKISGWREYFDVKTFEGS